MIIWQRTAEPQASHTLYVKPIGCTEMYENGRPKTVAVCFRYGRAEVPDTFGRWLVANEYARETRQLIIIPEGVRLHA